MCEEYPIPLFLQTTEARRKSMHYYITALTYILGCSLLHTSLDLKQISLVKEGEERKNYTNNIFLLLFFELLSLSYPPDDLLPYEVVEHFEAHAGLSFTLVTVFGLMLFDRYLAAKDN